MIADTPSPPYFAVIFTSLSREDDPLYEKMANEMAELAIRQPGYLGFESARSGLGISVSYWRDLEPITKWKNVLEHKEAQRLGREKWYASYRVRIAEVTRDYAMQSND